MTTEPMIRYPITDRQREMCRIAQSAPQFIELHEIREMAAINLLQIARDETPVVVTEPTPGDIWSELPLLGYEDDDDDALT